MAINEGAGYRPILSVQYIVPVTQFNARPPSVVLYGQQLLFPQAPTAPAIPANSITYQQWFNTIVGIPMVWDQLKHTPDQTLEQVYQIWPQIPFSAIAETTLTVVGAGVDTLRGYYVAFQGQSIAPLFAQSQWWDESVDDILLPSPSTLANQASGQDSCG